MPLLIEVLCSFLCARIPYHLGVRYNLAKQFLVARGGEHSKKSETCGFSYMLLLFPLQEVLK